MEAAAQPAPDEQMRGRNESRVWQAQGTHTHYKKSTKWDRSSSRKKRTSNKFLIGSDTMELLCYGSWNYLEYGIIRDCLTKHPHGIYTEIDSIKILDFMMHVVLQLCESTEDWD